MCCVAGEVAGMNAAQIREQAARFIFNCEARLDAQKRLKVYALPSGDGGGDYEVAGICDGYHPHEAAVLRDLIQAGKHVRAEEMAVEFIARFTDCVLKWSVPPAVEVFLRDCAFNRGPRGALRILQIAVRVIDDGSFGPVTRAALAKYPPSSLLTNLRAARELYEKKIAPPVGTRAKFWNGLVNRWDNAASFARKFL